MLDNLWAFTYFHYSDLCLYLLKCLTVLHLHDPACIMLALLISVATKINFTKTSTTEFFSKYDLYARVSLDDIGCSDHLSEDRCS